MPPPVDTQTTEAFAGVANPAGGAATLSDAYAFCAGLARSHYENFNVGGWITPREKLPHVYAIYAWCRMVDDLGDEASLRAHEKPLVAGGQIDAAVSEHRLAGLDWWTSELDLAYSGQPTHPIAIAIQDTVHKFEIPKDPFIRLIHANRIDQGTGRFDTIDAVLDYCTYSANPVGHLYLYLFGYSDAERQRLADNTCTALQLTNFWQDVSRDYHERGRIYLPQRDMARFGVSESHIARGVAGDDFRALLAHECDLAMKLFRDGAPLVRSLDRRARLPVALFTRGGVAILEAIRKRNFDVLSERPSLSKSHKTRLLLSTWFSSKLGLGFGLPTH